MPAPNRRLGCPGSDRTNWPDGTAHAGHELPGIGARLLSNDEGRFGSDDTRSGRLRSCAVHACDQSLLPNFPAQPKSSLRLIDVGQSAAVATATLPWPSKIIASAVHELGACPPPSFVPRLSPMLIARFVEVAQHVIGLTCDLGDLV
jgi:hypothetical protein